MALALQGNYDSALKEALRAMQIAKSANDKSGEGWALWGLGFIYSKKGEYWKGFEKLSESQEMGKD